MQQSAGLSHILKEKWGCSEGLINMLLILPACWVFTLKVLSPSSSTKPDMEKGDGGLVVQDKRELQLCDDEGQHFAPLLLWQLTDESLSGQSLLLSSFQSRGSQLGQMEHQPVQNQRGPGLLQRDPAARFRYLSHKKKQRYRNIHQYLSVKTREWCVCNFSTFIHREEPESPFQGQQWVEGITWVHRDEAPVLCLKGFHHGCSAGGWSTR